jgi:hypothetical protein
MIPRDPGPGGFCAMIQGLRLIGERLCQLAQIVGHSVAKKGELDTRLLDHIALHTIEPAPFDLFGALLDDSPKPFYDGARVFVHGGPS